MDRLGSTSCVSDRWGLTGMDTAGALNGIPTEHGLLSKPACATTDRYIEPASVLLRPFPLFVQRIMSAFHSAMRGAQMLAVGILEWAVRYGYIPHDAAHTSSPVFMALVAAIALLGFWRQVSVLFALGTVEGILLIPFRLAESLLVAVVGAAPTSS
jgi:hypothetical protein